MWSHYYGMASGIIVRALAQARALPERPKDQSVDGLDSRARDRAERLHAEAQRQWLEHVEAITLDRLPEKARRAFVESVGNALGSPLPDGARLLGYTVHQLINQLALELSGARPWLFLSPRAARRTV